MNPCGQRTQTEKVEKMEHLCLFLIFLFGGKQGPCKLLNNTSYKNPGTTASGSKILLPTYWPITVSFHRGFFSDMTSPINKCGKETNIIKKSQEWDHCICFVLTG